MEATEAYAALHEERANDNAIMSALGAIIHRDMEDRAPSIYKLNPLHPQ